MTGGPRRANPMIRATAKITTKMKNGTCAIEAAVVAIPPNPRMPAIIAMTRKTAASRPPTRLASADHREGRLSVLKQRRGARRSTWHRAAVERANGEFLKAE